MPGEMDRVCTVEWKSDTEPIILEIPDEENPKVSTDSERTTWHELLIQVADSGAPEPSINGHELASPMTDAGTWMSVLLVLCLLDLCEITAFWRNGTLPHQA